MPLFRSLLCVVLAVSAVAVSDAQNRRRPNPAFQPPEVDPSLPNVLLIGDSISIGYMLDARKALQGKANVFRPATNCGPTTRGLEQIDQWLGDRKWDVVHWNFGLHDLKYLGANGKNLADPKAEGAHQQVPIDQYQENIETLARRIKRQAEVVIWRETTPVPAGAQGRVAGDSAKYNAAAAKVIAEVGGILTDPMFDYATSVKELQRPANVHYTREGSKKLGQHVAEVIEAAMKPRD